MQTEEIRSLKAVDNQECLPEDHPEKIKRVLRATAPACVRRIALNYAESTRAHPFRRVSDSFLNAVESNALNFIKNRIDKHPSRGVTLQ